MFAWLQASNLCELYPDKAGLFLKRFDSVWLQIKVDQPITTLIRNLSILGPTPGGAHIFQRCAHVSRIKPKWNYNFPIKIVISMNF